MKGISDKTKIAYRYRVRHWKAVKGDLLADGGPSDKAWRQAFRIIRRRVETRFLHPIDWILGMELRHGEGFAAVALQCVLVEFFEAFYQGKIYSQPLSDEEIGSQGSRLGLDLNLLKEHLQPNEYKSGAKMFRDFLRNHEPFSNAFTSNTLTGIFYSTIRCGLLHEAATKGTSVIRAQNGDLLIERPDGGGIVLYRTAFQKALREYLLSYENELGNSEALKTAFIRKMDDLCQIKRLYYFAYGSNLKRDRLRQRVGFIYACHNGFIENHKVAFNKESIDGSSKANLISSPDSKACGVCYELDAEGYEKLKSFEGGYDEREVVVYDENGKLLAIAKTFISGQNSNSRPKKDYVELIIEGAREHGLGEDCILQVIQSSNYDQL